MTERLDRALKALREFETGADPRAQETLARILHSASVSRRKRSKVARWLPMAAVLALSTAALAQPAMRETIRGFLSGHRSREATSAPPPPTTSPEPTETASRPVMPVEPEVESSVPPSPPVPFAAPPARSSTSPPRTPSSPEGARMPPAHPPDSAPSAKEAATDAPAPNAASSEEKVYERAHRLHFDDRSPTASISAWDEYLGRYPNGRFVPEAQYNRAIDLLKLQRYPEARAALLPFANGAYGAYHREDARELLRAIP